MVDWIFSPIDRSFNRETFNCEAAELNTYLRQYARQNHNKRIASTFVATTEEGSKKICGYYSICAAAFKFDLLPDNYSKQLPGYDIPAVLIARLARDLSFKGQGLGEELLMDALLRAVRVADIVAVFAVVVKAKNEKAKNFYQRYGFISLQDSTDLLFLPMENILEEFNQPESSKNPLPN